MEDAAASLQGFQWADESVGKRHRLGGDPFDGQRLGPVQCPSCTSDMTFYGQLDSISDEHVLADCMVVEVFVCFDCFEAKARLNDGGRI